MLQWMGGSRQKVTTSRRSTQKRQRQYFEQRKRQHQEQEQNISGLESYSHKRVPSTQCHENNRSLDVLSLLNLSKNGQDCTSRLSEGKGRSNGEHTTLNDQTAQCPNASQMETKNLHPSEHVEIRETRIASNHLEETVCCQDHHGASESNDAKDQLKKTEYKLSVVDMLSDDGQNSSSRGNLVLENHVAFSVEGLGEVEMETPVHSPQHPTRNFSYGCPAPSKIYKGFHSSKNLNSSLDDQLSELDDIAFGVDLPTDATRLELPSYIEELCHNSKKKTTVGKERLLQNARYFLTDDEFYDRRVKQDGFKWHDESSFLDDSYVDDNCGIPRKSWSCDLDSCISRSRNYDKPEFSFEGLHMRNRASVKAASSFNKQGLSSPYKQQMDHGCDFIVSNKTGYPTTGNNCEFSEMTHCSAWPTLQRKDTRDRLSLFCEDSCLSSAVWHEGAVNTFNYIERQKARGPEADSRRPAVNKFSTKRSTFDQEFGQQESGFFSGTRNRMPDFSTPEDVWLFGAQCNSENVKPGYASMNASETKKDSPFDSKHWTEEPFDPDFYPKVYVDDKQSASRSDHDAFSGNLFSEKVAFCQQVSPIHSSHIIKSADVECVHQESFTGHFKKERDFRTMNFQESVSTGENRSVTLPAISSTLHQSNYSSSTKEKPMNVLDLEDSHSQSKCCTLGIKS